VAPSRTVTHGHQTLVKRDGITYHSTQMYPNERSYDESNRDTALDTNEGKLNNNVALSASLFSFFLTLYSSSYLYSITPRFFIPPFTSSRLSFLCLSFSISSRSFLAFFFVCLLIYQHLYTHLPSYLSSPSIHRCGYSTLDTTPKQLTAGISQDNHL
jgi:hypothetical protein